MLRCGAPESSLRPLTPVRHAYLANKSFRDFVRLQAVVLFQKDYENAWLLRGGRPTPAELRGLADAFLAKDGRCCTARETLAWLEVRPGRDRAALGSPPHDLRALAPLPAAGAEQPGHAVAAAYARVVGAGGL